MNLPCDSCTKREVCDIDSDCMMLDVPLPLALHSHDDGNLVAGVDRDLTPVLLSRTTGNYPRLVWTVGFILLPSLTHAHHGGTELVHLVDHFLPALAVVVVLTGLGATVHRVLS